MSTMKKSIAHYFPVCPQDIEVEEGDIFLKIKEIGNGWAVGTNESSGATGYFPLSYITDYDGPVPGILRRLASNRPKAPFFHPSDEAVQSAKQELLGNNYKGGNPTRSMTNNEMELQDMNVLNKRHVGNEPDANLAYKLFDSDRGQFRIIKGFVGALMGLFAGGVLFILLYYSFKFPLYLAAYITIGVAVLFTFGLAISVHCRCVAFLMLPSLTTGKGRAAILTIIFGLLLTGPVHNISANSSKISESMACTTTLIVNQTGDLKEQLQAPLNEISIQFDASTEDLKRIGRAIESVFAPIKSGLNAIANGAQAVADSLNAASVECNKIFTGAYNDCVKEISGAKSKCKSALNSFRRRRKKREVYEFFRTNKKLEFILMMNGMRKLRYKRGLSDICNVLSTDVLCGVLKIANNVCKPVELLDAAANKIAEGANALIDEIGKWFAFDILKDTIIGGIVNQTKSVAEFISNVRAELDVNILWIVSSVSLASKILALTLLLLLFQSFFYLKNYLSKDDYNNNYITSDFKRYDRECRAHDHPFVLPLQQNEMKLYINTKTLKLAKQEVTSSLIGLSQILLHMLIIFVVVFFDYILYYCMYLVNRYGNVNIDLAGEATIVFDITGSGVMATLIRGLASGINIHSVFQTNYNLTECLPNPSEPDIQQLYIFIVLYAVVILCVFLQAYSLRLRRKICAYYYPEQERERILWLHKRIIHNRTSHKLRLNQYMRTMKKETRVNAELSLCAKLTVFFPCLKCCFKIEARTCLNCGTNEGGGQPFTTCSNTECLADYCTKCYNELNTKCLACGQLGDF